MKTGANQRWVILVVVYLSVLAFAITLQAVPPVLSLIMADLKLSHTQGGLLMSLFALPGIFIAIPAGLLADRYSQRVIGVVSFVLMIAGTAIFAAGGSLPLLILGRVIAGTGAITLLVVAPQILAQWFAGREVGIAMGVFNTAMPLGTILSLNFLSRVGEGVGWRTSIWLSAGLAVVALVVFVILFAPAPRPDRSPASPHGSLWQGIRQTGSAIWLVGIAWMLFNASVISLFTFTPGFLGSTGFSVSSAGFITSAVMWPSLLLSPLVGYVIDRIDYKRAMIAAGGTALAVLIFLVPAATGWILALMLVLGVAQTLVPAPIFALPPEVTPPEKLGLGFGIVSTCLNIGIVVGPAVVGLLRDVTGSYQASYVLMAGLALLVVAAILALRKKTPSPSPSRGGQVRVQMSA